MSLNTSGNLIKQLLKSHHQRVTRFKRNVQQVYRLTKEAWEFDIKNATIVILLNIFASLCRYIETVLDAAIVTHSLFGLQNHDSFNKDYFGRLIAVKVLLVVVKYGGSLYGRGVSNSLEAVILRKREVRLLKAYFRLPYPQQVKKGIRTKFMEVHLSWTL